MVDDKVLASAVNFCPDARASQGENCQQLLWSRRVGIPLQHLETVSCHRLMVTQANCAAVCDKCEIRANIWTRHLSFTRLTQRQIFTVAMPISRVVQRSSLNLRVTSLERNTSNKLLLKQCGKDPCCIGCDLVQPRRPLHEIVNTYTWSQKSEVRAVQLSAA